MKSDGLLFSTQFRLEYRLVRLPFSQRYALPVPLKTEYKTTYVEVLDASNDISCVYAQRHMEYLNPYEIKKSVETVVEVQEVSVNTRTGDGQPKEDDLNSNMIAAVRKILNKSNETPLDIQIVKEDQKTVVPVNPILQYEAEYQSQQVVFIENKDAFMITGVFWANAEHWRACNEELLTPPSIHSLYPVNAAANMPSLLRQLHMIYVLSLKRSAVYDSLLPQDIPNRIIYPHLPALDLNVLNDVLDSVKEEATTALAMVYSGVDLPLTETLLTDYENTGALVTRVGLYATDTTDVLANPLTPWLNKSVRRRWGMVDYVKERIHYGKTYPLSQTDSEWGRFFVKNGTIVGVLHPSGQTYGEIEHNTEPLQGLRIQLAKLENVIWEGGHWSNDTAEQVKKYVDGMIQQGLGETLTFVCYYNQESGFLYVSHPLFPPGTCIVFRPMESEYYELELLLNKVVKATESLTRYNITDISW